MLGRGSNFGEYYYELESTLLFEMHYMTLWLGWYFRINRFQLKLNLIVLVFIQYFFQFNNGNYVRMSVVIINLGLISFKYTLRLFHGKESTEVRITHK